MCICLLYLFLLYNLVTNRQEKDSNTASVAGWSVAGVLGLVLIVLVLVFLLHRNNRLPGMLICIDNDMY